MSGVVAGGIYNRPVTIGLANAAAHPRAKLFLNGQPCVNGTTIEKDGRYLLEIRETDAVGRPLEHKPIAFTIDRTPPVIVFTYPEGGGSGALPEVEVVDDNLDAEALRLFLDGRPYDEDEPPEPGEHVFEATTRDRANNWARASVSVTTAAAPCQETEYVRYIAPTTKLSAAHYYPWYHGAAGCPGTGLWCDCVFEPKSGNPRPALGFYGSDSQATTNSHIQQMVNYGIDVVAVQWDGVPYETNNFLNYVLPAVSSRPIKFVLLYGMAIRDVLNLGNENKCSRFIGDFQDFAGSFSYLTHAKHLAFANQPVVYLYAARGVEGLPENIQAAFDAIHAAAVQNGFGGLFIVADFLKWDSMDWTKLQRMRPSAVTSFCPVTSGRVPENDAQRPIRQWADQMASMYSGALTPLQQYFGNNLELVNLDPGIFPQFDSHGKELPTCFSTPPEYIWAWHLLDSSDWDYMITTAGTGKARIAEYVVVLPTCRKVRWTNSDYTSIVWTYSFNEWYEGAGIEELAQDPTFGYPYDFGVQPLAVLQQRLP